MDLKTPPVRTIEANALVRQDRTERPTVLSLRAGDQKSEATGLAIYVVLWLAPRGHHGVAMKEVVKRERTWEEYVEVTARKDADGLVGGYSKPDDIAIVPRLN